MKTGFGWRPDIHDHRDVLFSVGRVLRTTEAVDALPESVSYKSYVPFILDQNPLGSCVVNAPSYAFMTLDNKAGRFPEPMSRLFAYWHSRNQHGDTQNDSGTYIRTAIKVLNKLGRPPESAWPYVVDDLHTPEPTFTRKPPPRVLAEGYDRRPAIYRRIDAVGSDRIPEVKLALANGFMVVFGTLVSDEFASYTQRSGEMRVWNHPAPEDLIAGGHAMCAVGYDAIGVDVVNSWGPFWGQNGFCRLGWAYITWPDTQDIWAIGL